MGQLYKQPAEVRHLCHCKELDDLSKGSFWALKAGSNPIDVSLEQAISAI